MDGMIVFKESFVTLNSQIITTQLCSASVFPLNLATPPIISHSSRKLFTVKRGSEESAVRRPPII